MHPRTIERPTEDYDHQRQRAERRARGLGWFSLGLGIAQLIAPRNVARLIGVRDDEHTCHVLRTIGVRELSSGAAILTNTESAGPVWTRVIGDVMDLGLLGLAMQSEDAQRDRLLAATVAVAGITLVDALSAAELGRANDNGRANGGNGSLALEPMHQGERVQRRIRMARAITVKRSRADAYAFWKNFENLPKFFEHVESIQTSGGRSRWRSKLFAENPLEWEAEIILDRPEESIEWRSFDGGDIASRGVVHFVDAPGGRGTEVRVELEYEPKGVLGASFAKLFGRMPAQQIANDLRRFKQLLEVGEIVHSDASVHRGMHPARPSPNELTEKAVST
jgi:uncharacterized membrane protein